MLHDVVILLGKNLEVTTHEFLNVRLVKPLTSCSLVIAALDGAARCFCGFVAPAPGCCLAGLAAGPERHVEMSLIATYW